MKEEPESKEELLDRFRADLKRPLAERYYSEDELISVFDYAGDAMDDYVRSEALLLGIRLYPESSELLARRAIFYRDYDQTTLRSFLDDNPGGSDAIMAMMRVAVADLSEDEAREALEDILLSYSFADDEAVIRFVQTAHEVGADRWLVDNIDRVREKVDYLPTLLYEIAILSSESEPYASVAAKLLEELTELEPYAPEFWTMLSVVYAREDRYEEARTAVEYALAIQPDYVDALKAKLRTYFNNPTDPEVGRVLEQLGQYAPEDPEIAYLRVTRLEEEKRFEEIDTLIDSLTPEARASQIMAMKAIEYGNENLEQILHNLYTAGFTEEQVWRDLAEFALVTHNLGALMKIMEVYEGLNGHVFDRTFIDYRILFAMHRYEEAINLFVGAEQDSELRQASRMMECYAMYVMMLLRSNRVDEAHGAAEAMVTMIETEPGLPGTPIEKYGMKKVMEEILKKLKGLRSTNWEKYDPFGFDK